MQHEILLQQLEQAKNARAQSEIETRAAKEKAASEQLMMEIKIMSENQRAEAEQSINDIRVAIEKKRYFELFGKEWEGE